MTLRLRLKIVISACLLWQGEFLCSVEGTDGVAVFAGIEYLWQESLKEMRETRQKFSIQKMYYITLCNLHNTYARHLVTFPLPVRQLLTSRRKGFSASDDMILRPFFS